ncbi:hypothetical protein niasHT_006891 [Heterodera trifolii]|uniref:BPTI/Kunitz inhibitor domain-containing protein n=1 Tax=Heterodera trifolii TaxID=157864 RepID=A0ABD2LMV7_9BILA
MKYMLHFTLLIITLFSYTQAEQADEICVKSRDKGNKECSNPSRGRRFFFDTVTKRCQPFVYLGCEGNENRFENLAECKKNCADYQPKEKKGPMVLPVPKCNGGVRAAIDSVTNFVRCPENKCPEGYKCDGTKCCPETKEFVCKLENDSGKYVLAGKQSPHFFYKAEVHNCQVFTYFGALGNANNFENYKECMAYCKNV